MSQFFFISWDYKNTFSSIFSHFPLYLISEIRKPADSYVADTNTIVFLLQN